MFQPDRPRTLFWKKSTALVEADPIRAIRLSYGTSGADGKNVNALSRQEPPDSAPADFFPKLELKANGHSSDDNPALRRVFT